MQLVVLGLNHRSAAVEVRERFSFEKNEVETALNRLYEYEKFQNASSYRLAIVRKFMPY